MKYELKDIQEIRKKAGLTQSQLAKQAKVSQSLIAKIEAGRLDPTYTKAQRIFAALETLTEKQETKAEEIMTSKVVSVSSEDNIQAAIHMMKKYEISQLPVIDKDKVVGFLSEAIILEELIQGKKDVRVKDIMKETPPTIESKASINIVSNLLKFYPMVLVVEKGVILGIITKSDIIRKLSDARRFGLFGYNVRIE
jgi:predicted transcriptional regulator